MPVFIFLGWIIGLVLGGIATVPLFLALALPAAVTITLLLFFVFAVAGYLIGATSVAPFLPGATGLAVIPFPLAGTLRPPGGAPITIAASRGEFFGRGLLIGLNAAGNAIVLSLVPVVGLIMAIWAFIVISLAAVLFVARNRIYQGFLGWSAWLFPFSYLATAVGLLLFIINIPFAFAAFGLGAFAIDFTTGAIETLGGLPAIFSVGPGVPFVAFTLGNFTFLGGTAATSVTPGRFVAPSISSHETGHTLNTAAMGGAVLWINAVDENVFPSSANLAYGELLAEGHTRLFAGPDVLPFFSSFSLRLWF